MTESALAMKLGTRAEKLDEERVLLAASRKDPEAAGRLFDKYYPEVFGYIYHQTFDRAAAEDLTSNVFLSAFRHLGFFRWRGVPFRAWLYRIATNEIRMHYRKQKRATIAHSSAVSLEQAGEAPSAAETLASTEDYQLLHRALLELRLKYRTVLLLRYFEGKSISEISNITGRNEGTIKSQLHRGLTRLQAALERLGVVPQ